MLRSNKLNSAWLLLTNRCNLSCDYCWVPTLGKTLPPEKMSIDTACEAIEFLNKNSTEGIAVTLFGGEPLLEYQTIKQLILKYPYMNWCIYTNTILLNREMLEFFYQRRDFISLRLSIDGRFEKQLRNRGRLYDETLVREVFASFPTAEARITVQDPEGVYEDALHLYDLGARHLSIKVTNFLELDEEFYPVARLELDLIKNDAKLKEITLISDGSVLECCNIVSDYVAIAPNGDIYPCDLFYWLQKHKLGNIRTGFDLNALAEIESSIFHVKGNPISSCIAEQLYFEEVAINNKKYFRGACV